TTSSHFLRLQHLRRNPRPPLFPYTTLFRSRPCAPRNSRRLGKTHFRTMAGMSREKTTLSPRSFISQPITSSASYQSMLRYDALRSEEHTSELQSRGHLVCRLLLEKKN